jgi:hypothetical protein
LAAPTIACILLFDADFLPSRSIKEIFRGAEFGKWVQISSVTCSWLKASRTAFLLYNNAAILNDAAAFLLTHRNPSGRPLACNFEPPGPKDRPNRFILKVLSLDLDCTEEWFKDILPGPLPPLNIRFKKQNQPSQVLSDTESKEMVETLLRSIGPIEQLNFYNDPKAHKLNITASFFDPENANKAVEKLHCYVEGFGQLSVKLQASVKLNVQTNIIEAIRADLEQLTKKSREEHRVRLKIPSPNNKDKYNLPLRISADGGDAPKLVAKVKVELEKLLAGTVITNAAVPLWHNFFGQETPSSLLYLKKVSYENRLYIHRDLRISQLVFYGGTATNQGDAQRALVAKVAELNRPHQTIVSSSFVSSCQS